MRRRIAVALIALAFITPSDDIMALVENTVAPVVTSTGVSNVERTDAAVCFDWTLKKHRAPRQLFFLFYGHGGDPRDRTMLNVCARSPDGECRPLRTSRSAAPGETRTRRLCTTLPPELAFAPSATIEGFSVYEGVFGLWRLPYLIGPFRTTSGEIR